MLKCINNLFEAGQWQAQCEYSNSNKNARIAIRTQSGMSEQFNIHENVMQGTVWCGLMCTCTMDKLDKLAYQDKSL